MHCSENVLSMSFLLCRSNHGKDSLYYCQLVNYRKYTPDVEKCIFLDTIDWILFLHQLNFHEIALQKAWHVFHAEWMEQRQSSPNLYFGLETWSKIGRNQEVHLFRRCKSFINIKQSLNFPIIIRNLTQSERNQENSDPLFHPQNQPRLFRLPMF